MRIRLITVGRRQPAWITDGFREYARRMTGGCSLELVEIPLGRRTGAASVARAVEEEGERMLRAVLPGAHVVALTVDGRPWSTAQLAARLQDWMSMGSDVCLLVGGPDGLCATALGRAHGRWSISPLTLPHGLVRLILAEALYRAWSLNQGHPYHRP